MNNNVFIDAELPELSVLVAAVSAVSGGLPPNSRREPVQLSRCDDSKLLALARWHGVLPWLWEYCTLLSVHGDRRATELRDALSVAYKVETFKSLHQETLSIELSRVLSQKGVVHVVFKGVAAFKQFYRGQVSSRPADDMDILVSTQALADAVAVLEQQGYHARDDDDVERIAAFVARNAHLYRWRDIGFQRVEQPRHHVDLHWRIADSFTFPAVTEQLVAKRHRLLTDKGDIPCLPFDDHFVYVCVHAHSDYFFRLRYLVDVFVATLRDEFDLQKVLKVADGYGVRAVVEQSIACARFFFSEASSESMDDYTRAVIERFTRQQGRPHRAHPNKGEWSSRDKRQHLAQQIRNRSTLAYWFEPVVARLKLGPRDVGDWNDDSSVYSLLLKRMFMRR